MTRRAIAKGFSLSAERMFSSRTQKLITRVGIGMAASVTFMPLSAGADDLQIPVQDSAPKPVYTQGTLADEAPHITPAPAETAPGEPASPPSTYTQGTLADEAPNITPVVEDAPAQAQPSPQAVTPAADAKGALPDKAPEIIPIAPDIPETDTTKASQK